MKYLLTSFILLFCYMLVSFTNQIYRQNRGNEKLKTWEWNISYLHVLLFCYKPNQYDEKRKGNCECESSWN